MASTLAASAIVQFIVPKSKGLYTNLEQWRIQARSLLANHDEANGSLLQGVLTDEDKLLGNAEAVARGEQPPFAVNAAGILEPHAPLQKQAAHPLPAVPAHALGLAPTALDQFEYKTSFDRIQTINRAVELNNSQFASQLQEKRACRAQIDASLPEAARAAIEPAEGAYTTMSLREIFYGMSREFGMTSEQRISMLTARRDTPLTSIKNIDKWAKDYSQNSAALRALGVTETETEAIDHFKKAALGVADVDGPKKGYEQRTSVPARTLLGYTNSISQYVIDNDHKYASEHLDTTAFATQHWNKAAEEDTDRLIEGTKAMRAAEENEANYTIKALLARIKEQDKLLQARKATTTTFSSAPNAPCKLHSERRGHAAGHTNKECNEGKKATAPR